MNAGKNGLFEDEDDDEGRFGGGFAALCSSVQFKSLALQRRLLLHAIPTQISGEPMILIFGNAFLGCLTAYVI